METETQKETMNKRELVWSDEFDTANGSSPDPKKWVLELGNNRGWGNNELQVYTDSLENCSIVDGHLVIRALQEEIDGFDYSSARLKTYGLYEVQYGRIEMRAKLPQGKGIWPAFWMLGADIETVPWPQCGEIDIMEHIGREPDLVHGTVHGPEYHGNMGIGKAIQSDTSLYDEFHTYAIEWDTESIRWYFDDQQYHQIVKSKLLSTYTWVFDKPYFILINLAVGGNWPQNPDDTTTFPQEYIIDYVRVYR